MDTPTPMERYQQLEERLRACRRANPMGSASENEAFEQMQLVWCSLTQEERNMLGGERSTCVPDSHLKPFEGAEVGVNLFWLDGLNRYLYIEGDRGPGFAIHFLVNAGRKHIEHYILPEPTAVFLTRAALKPHSPRTLSTAKPVFSACLVEEFSLVYETPPEEKGHLLQRIRTDPHFFDRFEAGS